MVVAVALMSVGDVGAISPGLGGYSGKQGWNCAFCHGGGAAPEVRFEGPQEVVADAVATFSFIVQSQSPNQSFAGFNVATSDGLLDVLPGEGARTEAGEIVHQSPKPAADGETSWAFTWRASTQPGQQALYGAAVSSNGNGNKNGDGVATTTLDVTVVPELQRGDANCDGRVSAADLVQLAMLVPFGDFGACDGADVNDDGIVNEDDIDTGIEELFL